MSSCDISSEDENDVQDNVPSLSKGCYVFKPKSAAREDSKVFNSKVHKQWSARHSIYKSLWGTLNNSVEQIQKQIFSEIVHNVLTFAQRAYTENKDSEIVISEIPTAALILGVNLPDHSLLFQQITEKLKQSLTPYVVSLKSGDAGTLASLVQTFVYALTESTDVDGSGDEVLNIKKNDCTLHFIHKWYKEKENEKKLHCSPRKKSRTSKTVHDKNRPVVILFEDLEAFNSTVLEDFILTCNVYEKDMPFVFVMGIASASVTIHRLLPQKALSCLSIETFHSAPAAEYINKLIYEVIINSDVPFKLGPKIFQLLVDIVLFHDFSIANFSHMLKLCMFEHFYENEHSILCCPLPDLKTKLEMLNTAQLEGLCKLPSVLSYLKDQKHNHLNDGKAIKEFIYTSLKELHNSHQTYVVFLSCLHSFIKSLPGNPMGKQLREMYISGLEANLSDTKGFKQAFKLLGMLSKKELEVRIEESVLVLNDIELKSDVTNELKKNLQSFLEKLNKLDEQADQPGETSHSDATPINLGGVRSRSQLKEKLKSVAQEPKLSAYEALKCQFLEYLQSLFIDATPLCTMPFHESLYFNSPSVIRKSLIASPRVAYHRALANPQAYLQCKCCRLRDISQIRNTMPAISIAYKLYLECGRLINLHDWLQAFKAIRMEDKSRGTLKNGESCEESYVHAQFLHSVSELNFLGYLKTSKKKKDHVEKLVWGSSW